MRDALMNMIVYQGDTEFEDGCHLHFHENEE